MLPTKTLLPITLILVFLSGIMLGFGVFDAWRGDYRPVTVREQALVNAATNARLSTASAADVFHSAMVSASQSYALALAADTRTIVHGGTDAALMRQLDTRANALAAPLSSYVGASAAQEITQQWTTVTTAIEAYAAARYQADAATTKTAQTSLNNEAHNLANRYYRAVPSLSAATLGLLSQRFADQAQAMVEAQRGASMSAAFSAEEQVLQTLVNWADTVTAGVIRQQPTQF